MVVFFIKNVPKHTSKLLEVKKSISWGYLFNSKIYANQQNHLWMSLNYLNKLASRNTNEIQILFHINLETWTFWNLEWLWNGLLTPKCRRCLIWCQQNFEVKENLTKLLFLIDCILFFMSIFASKIRFWK